MATAIRGAQFSAMPSEHSGPAYQAYRTLYAAFIALPIIAGLDKFFMLLTNWDSYLAPQIVEMLRGHGHQFMLAVGIIEIVAGIGVALRPKYFSYVVAAWLGCIVLNLLIAGSAFDVALRDCGLALGAVALGRLAAIFDHRLLG